MPATKKFDERHVGLKIQHHYEFLERLWGPDGAGMRAAVDQAASEAALRDLLASWGIADIDADTRLMVIDVENARTKSYVTDPETQKFYVLVLPPKLTRSGAGDFKEAQAWRGAYYHALSDGYGM